MGRSVVRPVAWPFGKEMIKGSVCHAVKIQKNSALIMARVKTQQTNDKQVVN